LATGRAIGTDNEGGTCGAVDLVDTGAIVGVTVQDADGK
jgi:hypothetical protein